MAIRICALIENTVCRSDLHAEHGLSLYIEALGHRILFDSGQSGALVENAEKMGVDLSLVDMAILSHGHYDHGGGLKRFFSVNNHAPVFIHAEAFAPCYAADGRYIGLDRELRDSGRLIFVGEEYALDEGLRLFACNALPKLHPVSGDGLCQKRGEECIPDDFRHEQYLLIEDGENTVVISGCSHKGIGNVMYWLHPKTLVGGFHFKGVDPQNDAFMREAAMELSRYETCYYTCHCTGSEQYTALKTYMGEKLHYLSGGQELIL